MYKRNTVFLKAPKLCTVSWRLGAWKWRTSLESCSLKAALFSLKCEKTTLFVQISLELRVLGAFVKLRDMRDVATTFELNSNTCFPLLLIMKMRGERSIRCAFLLFAVVAVTAASLSVKLLAEN